MAAPTVRGYHGGSFTSPSANTSFVPGWSVNPVAGDTIYLFTIDYWNGSALTEYNSITGFTLVREADGINLFKRTADGTSTDRPIAVYGGDDAFTYSYPSVGICLVGSVDEDYTSGAWTAAGHSGVAPKGGADAAFSDDLHVIVYGRTDVNPVAPAPGLVVTSGWTTRVETLGAGDLDGSWSFYTVDGMGLATKELSTAANPGAVAGGWVGGSYGYVPAYASASILLKGTTPVFNLATTGQQAF